MEANAAREIIQVVGVTSPQIDEEVIALASVFRSWAYEVRVIAPLNRPFRQRLAGLGVRVTDAPLPAGASLAAHWANVHELARRLRGARPLLIHAHGWRAGLAAALSRHGLAEPTPIVLSPHFTPDGLSSAPRSWLRRLAWRRALRQSDAVIVSTETQRRQLASLDATVATRAELIPYGISRCPADDSLDFARRRQLFGMTPSAAIVGCVADGLQAGDLARFLNSARELCLRYPSLEFAIIGSDVDRKHYHDLAHERGVLGAMVFVDPRERFSRALSALNVLVIPQAGWPSGMLALQALSQDVGVVALSGGEITEMLSVRPGVTIAAADGAPALGRAIMAELRAAADRMPLEETGANAPGVSPFLVSQEFDLDQAWTAPLRPSPDALAAELSIANAVSAFAATHAARSLVTVYDRVLTRN